ncbi:very short patch repair endonuclease [Bradyrhizobium sp. UFLA05-153]
MSREKRSALMGRIRGRNTGPELTVRRLLHAMGYRFRLHARELPGKPDIIFRSRRVALFVHGCFWHRHDCGLAYIPKTRPEFWQRKFEGNIVRDRRTKQELEAAGWRVVVVWECQLSDLAALSKNLAQELGRPGVLVRRVGTASAQCSGPKTRAQAKSARQ